MEEAAARRETEILAPLALLPGNGGLHPRKGGPGAKGLRWSEMNVAAAALPLTHKRSSEPTLPPRSN